MHEICLPFLDLSDPKQLWKKIDPTYLPSGVRIDITDETQICSSRDLRQGIKFPKEYGTVSEFYFMELEMIHFGLLHTMRKYQDVKKLMDRLKEEKKAIEGQPGQERTVEKYDAELKNLRNFRIAFELALCDYNLAKLIEKFYLVHMKLMRDWGEYDEQKARFGVKDHPNMFCYLPENFLRDLIECFSDILRTNSKEYKAFMPDTAVAIYEFCIALIRTD